jgi:hypothetical protein
VFYKMQGISEQAEDYNFSRRPLLLRIIWWDSNFLQQGRWTPQFLENYAVSTGTVTNVHDITSQMTWIFMNTTTRTSNFTLYKPPLGSYSVTCLQIWEGNYSPVNTVQHPTRLPFFAYKYTHIYVQSHSIFMEKLKYGNIILKFIH